MPVISHERLDKTIGFLADFVGMLGEMGLIALRRDQKHEELEESEERYRSLFDNATEGIMVFRVERDAAGDVDDLVVVDLNPTQVTRTGATREQLVGRGMRERDANDEHLLAYFDTVADAISSGRFTCCESCLRIGDVCELLTAYPAGGDLWALSARNVTEVRDAEQALRRQEERIRRAHVDVIDAVTGGKLILLTEDTLAGELGQPLTDAIPITAPAQPAEARRQIVDAAERRYPGRLRHTDLLSPVCEALDNALKHAHGGTYQVFAKDGRLQVTITDEGPGIDFRTLPKATVVTGYSTAASLEMGFTIMLKLCECVLLSTRPGHTQVVLELAAARKPAPHG